MATCKECLYWLKCLSRISYVMDYDEITGKEITDIEKRCSSFKDKSRYIEIVRCKDCIHWGGVTYGFVCRKFSGINTKICMHADEYCSYGERKNKPTLPETTRQTVLDSFMKGSED